MRKQAEEMAREQAARLPENLKAMSPEEIHQLLHELRVHQIELEMQNEELRTAQVRLDTANSSLRPVRNGCRTRNRQSRGKPRNRRRLNCQW
ncbi:MAG: hypothetical protein AB7S77_14215 [Desulfatirhabdiaceae bacterium]